MHINTPQISTFAGDPRKIPAQPTDGVRHADGAGIARDPGEAHLRMLGAPASLRLRLIVSIAVVLIVILALGSGLVYWHAEQEVQVELGAAIDVGAHTVHNAVDDVEEAAHPLRHLELLVADFDGDRHLRASLISSDDRVIYRSTPQPPSDPAPDWFYRLLAARTVSSRIELPAPFASFGTILLQADSRNEISEVWGDVTLTLSILGIFCGLNAVLVYWVTGRALRPLDAISAAFDGIGTGDYGLRVKEHGPRELAQLCRGFNLMAERLAEIQNRQHRLEHQLAAVQEEERAELARDLHDEIGPLLFAVSVDLSILQQDDTVSGTPIAARIESVRDSIGLVYKEVKAILGRLRPATLVDLGLAQAAEGLVSFWQTRYPAVAFDLQVPVEGFGMKIDNAIYHIIQESLSNALRHGKPTRIAISVRVEKDEVLTTISDNGIGLKPKGHGTPGFGLIGMQERVKVLGGTLNVSNSSVGAGVVVSARLPTHPPTESTNRGTLQRVAQQ
jgi:two-component system, NarL family, sensor histidine kinase UhpB